MHMRIGVYCRKIVGKNEFTPVNSNTFRKIYSATPQEYMTFRVVKVCIVTALLFSHRNSQLFGHCLFCWTEVHLKNKNKCIQSHSIV